MKKKALLHTTRCSADLASLASARCRYAPPSAAESTQKLYEQTRHLAENKEQVFSEPVILLTISHLSQKPRHLTDIKPLIEFGA